MGSLFTTPTERMTFDDVVQFCAEHRPEHVRLEYKRTFSNKNPGKQIAKEAAAFANTQGGTIIFGVEEGENRRPAPNQPGANLGRDPRQTVLNACASEVFPPINPDVTDYLRNPADPDCGFLVIRIGVTIGDIHSVDGGSGIYIRIADQSEPIRATLDQIEIMLARQRRGVDWQEDRRSHSVKVLKMANKRCRERGTVWVSVGPKALFVPLMSLGDLTECAMDCSVSSSYHNQIRFPICDASSVTSVADGIVSSRFEVAGWADVYGNVTIGHHLLLEGYIGTQSLALAGAKVREDALGENLNRLDAASVMERVIASVRAANQIYNRAGFVGAVKVRVYVPQSKNLPLIVAGSRLDKAIGICALEEEIDEMHELLSRDLGGNLNEFLLPLTRRVLWAWGCSDSEQAKRVLDCARQYHFG